MSTPVPSVFALRCRVQEYEWGKLGEDSSVAAYAERAHDTTIDKEHTYAELWMGTHPNGPSSIKSTTHEELDGVLLKDALAQYPNELLTESVAATYEGDLPFLFKVLSVRKALSIQAHPDKALAEQLHASQPERYHDANHKPELMVALTEFEAMCGFRPASEIAMNIQIPELIELIGEEIIQEFCSTVDALDEARQAQDQLAEDADEEALATASEQVKAAEETMRQTLAKLFGMIMRSDRERVAETVSTLCTRLSDLPEASLPGSLEEIIIRLNQQYPGDVGCLCPLLLNLLHLQPGEAIFLGANEPHAYISGDCIECMATSDNVVRAGLTPKFIDVEVLVQMLTFTTRSVDQVKITPTVLPEDVDPTTSPSVTVYEAPVPEFTVARAFIPDGSLTLEPVHGPTLLLVVHGEGQLEIADAEPYPLIPGQVYFITPDTQVTLTNTTDTPLESYYAYCNASS
jgi:mannose-6-phosphate isomerase